MPDHQDSFLMNFPFLCGVLIERSSYYHLFLKCTTHEGHYYPNLLGSFREKWQVICSAMPQWSWMMVLISDHIVWYLCYKASS